MSAWEMAAFGLLCFGAGVVIGMLIARVYWTDKWAREVEKWAAEVKKWARLNEEWLKKMGLGNEETTSVPKP